MSATSCWYLMDNVFWSCVHGTQIKSNLYPVSILAQKSTQNFTKSHLQCSIHFFKIYEVKQTNLGSTLKNVLQNTELFPKISLDSELSKKIITSFVKLLQQTYHWSNKFDNRYSEIKLYEFDKSIHFQIFFVRFWKWCFPLATLIIGRFSVD